jgi:hypothetical protein
VPSAFQAMARATRGCTSPREPVVGIVIRKFDPQEVGAITMTIHTDPVSNLDVL